jgi:hypothetical protein
LRFPAGEQATHTLDATQYLLAAGAWANPL